MLMQSETVLEVERLCKLYSRSPEATRQRLAGLFRRTLFGRDLRVPAKLIKGEFWSLKDVSFSLKRGEALGIIGANGAGKTTLLRLLAGQLLPDDGEIRKIGNSAAMIDLTAGFQMSASGRRNIFLRGAMLGRSQEEIVATYDEIVDFAELGEAIDAPVSTYSSGMLMRLAFSIMVATKPDILFIDEILSVGDFRFRQKCLAYIRKLRETAAFVLVSHSMGDIKLFADRVIVIHNGEIVFHGKPEEAIKAYEDMKLSNPNNKLGKRAEILKPQFHNEQIIQDVSHYWCNADYQPINDIRSGETLYLKVSFRIIPRPRNLIMGVPVWSENGEYVTGFSTELQQDKIELEENEKVTCLLEIPELIFNPGVYISNFVINDGPEFLYRGENTTINVLPSKSRYWGVVTLPHQWHKIK